MYNGILPVFKKRGLTSHDVVFKLRKILKMKKIGHTGTLDPEVNGVLPICLGDATKVSDYIMEMGKTYHAMITLGKSTTTEDQTGDILETRAVDRMILMKIRLTKCCSNLRGIFNKFRLCILLLK